MSQNQAFNTGQVGQYIVSSSITATGTATATTLNFGIVNASNFLLSGGVWSLPSTENAILKYVVEGIPLFEAFLEEDSALILRTLQPDGRYSETSQMLPADADPDLDNWLDFVLKQEPDWFAHKAHIFGLNGVDKLIKLVYKLEDAEYTMTIEEFIKWVKQ